MCETFIFPFRCRSNNDDRSLFSFLLALGNRANNQGSIIMAELFRPQNRTNTQRKVFLSEATTAQFIHHRNQSLVRKLTINVTGIWVKWPGEAYCTPNAVSFLGTITWLVTVPAAQRDNFPCNTNCWNSFQWSMLNPFVPSKTCRNVHFVPDNSLLHKGIVSSCNDNKQR